MNKGFSELMRNKYLSLWKLHVIIIFLVATVCLIYRHFLFTISSGRRIKYGAPNILFSSAIFIASFLFLFNALSSQVIAGEKSNCWSYTIENGIEKSERSYLLVYTSISELPVKERKIEVISKCQRPYESERVYGTCTHNINIQPTDKVFSLDTGEDVIMIDSLTFLLGTIQYGCCGGPDIFKFYRENGEYIGTLKRLQLSRDGKSGYNSIITKFGFGTEYENKEYFVVEAEHKMNAFEALVFDGTGSMKRVPISFDIPLSANCMEWYLTEFTQYAHQEKLTLKMIGRGSCKHHAGEMLEKIFTCSASDSEITCFSEKVRK